MTKNRELDNQLFSEIVSRLFWFRERLIYLPTLFLDLFLFAFCLVVVALTTFDFLSAPTQPGDLGTLAHYRVISEIGRGGMGHVFEALDTKLKRSVALKVMNSKVASIRNSRKLFVREARYGRDSTRQCGYDFRSREESRYALHRNGDVERQNTRGT